MNGLIASRAAFAMLAGLTVAGQPARAELILSQLVIDLGQGSKQRDDIEIWNKSDERAYVAIDPSEIINPGKAGEIRHQEPDPEKRGLLVSPARMILEPGQRKLVRIAAIGPRQDRERVYRVTVKPVVGELASTTSGLKLLVGYDVLVLLRPTNSRPNVTASRSAGSLTFRNEGNTSLELIDGKQCDSSGKACDELPGKRLYAGAQWTQKLKSSFPVEYTILSNGRSVRRKF